MSISNETNSVTFVGDGVTTVFPFTFNIPDADSLQLWLFDTVTGNSTLIDPVNYSATGFGVDGGGSVTYDPASVPVPSTQRLTIFRAVAYTQNLNFSYQSSFLPVPLGQQLDKIVMQTQELADLVGRAAVLPIGSTVAPSDLLADIIAIPEYAASAAASASAAEIAAETAGVPFPTLYSWMDGKSVQILNRTMRRWMMMEDYIDTSVTPHAIYMEAGNPLDPTGATNWTPYHNARMAEIRSILATGNYDTEWPGAPWKRFNMGIGFQPGHRYRLDAGLDLTALQLRGFTIDGGGAQLFGNYTGGHPLMDCIGSAGFNIMNLSLEADNNTARNPSFGLAIGRRDVNEIAENMHLYNVRIDGWFQQAGGYNGGSELFTAEALQVYSYLPVPAWWIDSRDTAGIENYTQCANMTMTPGSNNSCIQHTFIGGGIRCTQQSTHGALRINSAEDADTDNLRVWNVQLKNTYLTNYSPDTTPGPAVYVKGSVFGLDLDIHVETGNISHAVYFDLSTAFNPTRIWNLRLRDPVAEAKLAIVGRSDNTNNLELVACDIGIGNSVGTYLGTAATLFDAATFTFANTKLNGQISSAVPQSTFLNLSLVNFDGIVRTNQPLSSVGLGSDAGRAKIETTFPGAVGFSKLSTVAATTNGAIAVNDADVVLLSGAGNAYTLSNGFRYCNFELVNQSANFVKVTGFAGSDQVMAPGAVMKVVQTATTFSASVGGASGIYVPTLTNTTNIASSSATDTDLAWELVGNTVRVRGRLTITLTAANTPSLLGISLPIASGLAAGYDLNGHIINAVSTSLGGGAIVPDTTNGRASATFESTSTSAFGYTVDFSYTVK